MLEPYENNIYIQDVRRRTLAFYEAFGYFAKRIYVSNGLYITIYYKIAMFSFHTKVTTAIAIAIMTAVVAVATPVSIYAQQEQMNFVASLTGKDMNPAVNTPATGTAKFHINTD